MEPLLLLAAFIGKPPHLPACLADAKPPLSRGFELRGMVVHADGAPAAAATIKAPNLGLAVVVDGDGRFALRGDLPEDAGTMLLVVVGADDESPPLTVDVALQWTCARGNSSAVCGASGG